MRNSDPARITRSELYEQVWREPMAKLKIPAPIRIFIYLLGA